MAVTPAQFKALKPQFSALADPLVQAHLDQALPWVEGWINPDQGQIALTCHTMTLEGMGNGAEAQAFAAGIGSFQSIKSGQLTITKGEISISGGGEAGGWLGQTQCGRQFAMLMRMERGGPRVASGALSGAQSGYAKDVNLPSFKWQGVGRE